MKFVRAELAAYARQYAWTGKTPTANEAKEVAAAIFREQNVSDALPPNDVLDEYAAHFVQLVDDFRLETVRES